MKRITTATAVIIVDQRPTCDCKKCKMKVVQQSNIESVLPLWPVGYDYHYLLDASLSIVLMPSGRVIAVEVKKGAKYDSPPRVYGINCN